MICSDRSERYLALFCALALIGFGATALAIALMARIDYWDSYNFLLQARRLTDASFSFVTVDYHRPRGLILLLVLFDIAWKAVREGYPPLAAYHVLMVGVAVGFVLT